MFVIIHLLCIVYLLVGDIKTGGYIIIRSMVWLEVWGSIYLELSERGKKDVYYNKQVEEVVTVLNCILKGSWKEGESGSIRKKLKCKAQLIYNIKIDEMIVDSI